MILGGFVKDTPGLTMKKHIKKLVNSSGAERVDQILCRGRFVEVVFIRFDRCNFMWNRLETVAKTKIPVDDGSDGKLRHSVESSVDGHRLSRRTKAGVNLFLELAKEQGFDSEDFGAGIVCLGDRG